MIVMTQSEGASLDAYEASVNKAMLLHLFPKDPGRIELEKLDDREFVDAIRLSERQPLNPLVVARDALDYPIDTPVIEIMDGLRVAYNDLLAEYEAHGIDILPALQAASDIIGHTEAYISGYSRALGSFANRLTFANPKHTGLKRWVEKIWVPEEDMHDRLLHFLMLARGNPSVEAFYDDHTYHMQEGMHVPLRNRAQSTAYLAQQEGATGPSYKGYRTLLGPVLGRIPKAIGDQEFRHTRFYTHLEADVMDEFPDEAVIELENEQATFEMPGKQGIRGYDDKSKTASMVGVLDPVAILKVQRSLASRLRVGDRQFKSDSAKIAQEKLVDPEGDYSEKRLAKRQRQLEIVRHRAVKKAQRNGDLLPAIIGVSVVADPATGELSFPISA